jgi:hypothetical protein
VPIIQVGLRKEPELPDVPLLMDLARNDRQREILSYVTRAVAVGRPIATTPGVPPARLQALRVAFDATVKDPSFMADAERQRLDVNTMTGAELEKIVAALIDAPQDIKAEVKQAIKPTALEMVKGVKPGKED